MLSAAKLFTPLEWGATASFGSTEPEDSSAFLLELSQPIDCDVGTDCATLEASPGSGLSAEGDWPLPMQEDNRATNHGINIDTNGWLTERERLRSTPGNSGGKRASHFANAVIGCGPCPAPAITELDSLNSTRTAPFSTSKQTLRSDSLPFSSKDLNSREKNRAAQRRFRERQQGKVRFLEQRLGMLQAQLVQAKFVECQKQGEIEDLFKQVKQLQADCSRMQLSEGRVHDLVNKLAVLQAGDGPGTYAKLPAITTGMTNLRHGCEYNTKWVMKKLLMFMKPEDFDATEPNLLATLQSSSSRESLPVQPGEVKVTLHTSGTGSDASCVTSAADFVNMPFEEFLALQASCGRALAKKLQTWPLGEVLGDPAALKLASELRAIVCCFCAVHTSQALLQQLGHVDTGIMDDPTKAKVLSAVKGCLSLSTSQLEALQKAVSTFKQWQSEVQAERQTLSNLAKGSLYSTASLSSTETARMLAAASQLRKNQEEDIFNVCRLTTCFITRVLTPEQYLQLTAAAHPCAVNIMGLIESLIEPDFLPEDSE